MTMASSIPPRQLFLQNENDIWLGSNTGLIRYQEENELWSQVTGHCVTDLYFDENIIWLGTNKGLHYADIRYLDWKNYTKEQGLSSDSIIKIAADLDFVYVASPHGLSRMDKLVEQWEPIGDFLGKQIYDMYSDQNFLWVATDKGIFVFEKQYEKWKQLTVSDGLISDIVHRIFYFKDYIWILTDKGFSRYSATMKTWNSYSLSKDIGVDAISYLWLDADFIWLNTPGGVVRFSGNNQTWEEFSKNKPIEGLVINGISSSGKTSWFATSDGVFSYDEEKRRWTTYTAIEGLNDDVQNFILCVGQTTITSKDNLYNTYFPSEDMFHSKEVSGGKGVNRAQKGEVFNDGRGVGFKTPGGQSASLLGRTYFKLKNKAEFPTPLGQSISDYINSKDLDSFVVSFDSSTSEWKTDTIARFKDFLYWWPKAQLNLNIDLNNSRSIRGSFDNTDPLSNLKYGLEYRGYGDDHIRQFGWLTNQKTDYFSSSLIDVTYFEGGALRTEFGSRIGEKKRRRINTGLWVGWRKTKNMQKLIPFQEDNFYYLNVNNIITETVEIIIDGKVIDPREYSIERTKGLLTFKNEGFVTPDSRIEISFEYEPKLGGHTNEMAGIENVVVLNDKLSIGLNGLYRGIKEDDSHGLGIDTNRLFVGSINGKIDLQSRNGKVTFKAIPEIAGSYNDSIVLHKQGTAGKLNINASIHNLKVKGQVRAYTSEYESPDDNLIDSISIYGHINHHEKLEATLDITPSMPISARFSFLDGKEGSENRQFLEYLLSPSGKPSIKIQGLHQNVKAIKRRDKTDPRIRQDSIQSKRWNARIETEWNLSPKALSRLHINRLWLNASYSLDLINDSLFTLNGSQSDYLGHFNHNIFSWLRFSPHKKLSIETKQIFRIFQQRNNSDSSWSKNSTRYRPEITLYSQELIPGITLYGKLNIDNLSRIIGSGNNTLTGKKSKRRLTSNILLIPGVWIKPLNPFQLNLGYTFSAEDSTNEKQGENTNEISNNFGRTYSLNPILDFSNNMRFVNRSEFSKQKNLDHIVSQGTKLYNDFEWLFNKRKTKFLIEYDLTTNTDYSLNHNYIDTLQTLFIKHDSRLKWTQKWKPLFRTELPININWQKCDTTRFQSTLLFDYRNSISSGILFDGKIQRKFIRELRIQYFIGATLYNGNFFEFDSYKKSWDNKLDLSLKAGRNFFIRALLNLNYLFDEKVLRYDLAEVKATCLF